MERCSNGINKQLVIFKMERRKPYIMKS